MTEEEESDDDIIEGCHFLKVDIKYFDFPRIWIRAEYIRLYEALEARYRMHLNPNTARAVVVTGQPGIGKSIWIYYALRRRLAEKKSVIWYYEGTRYLFVEEGVYKVPDGFRRFKSLVWTLVDSGNAKDEVLKDLVMPHARHFVIYCTSPSQDRWRHLYKTAHKSTFIMNPWKRKEILRVTSTLQSGAIPDESVNRVFHELGPIARLCINYLGFDDAIEEYRECVESAISNITASEVEKLLRDCLSLKMDAISRKICLISRRDKENVRSAVIVSPITPFIKSRLANRLRSLERSELIRLYKHFSNVPESRVFAGLYFEVTGQQCLQDGATLELLPMVKLPSSRSKTKPQWYSSHVVIEDETLEAFRKQVLKEQKSLTIPQGLPVEEYTGNCTSIAPNVIYVPASKNQVAFDSFILMDGLLYLFQFSIASNHDIKPGLLDFIHKTSGCPSIDNCCFVFIHPPDHVLVCPQPWRLEMQKLCPFSAVLNM
ncbi:hypothetical protein AMATHDRAFT_151083 [Amanita thiersii Skay4041]|uniref:Crinkler (CRN) family protein n=1 Tax=Amanita thiersii Skay4041 TaxID=703135 RepID=A0A2A9NEV1_9AGAR|nr:hypothetical protein AMATHDRAFT_151083 [Amanita thiersii Skay4041]